MLQQKSALRVAGYCALCRSCCGCISVVENGHLVAVEAGPSHPTGTALCIKGRAAPELVYAPNRLLHPLKRTRPKWNPDPGWQRISWEEALATSAQELSRIRNRVRNAIHLIVRAVGGCGRFEAQDSGSHRFPIDPTS
jgi:anaerobic selenocysteine-containing dehydrogenase